MRVGSVVGVEEEEMKGALGPTGVATVLGERQRGICEMTSDSAHQIGSYFGASLCSVDMDGDGSTDLVLVGAPHYYGQTRGGQVSVCPMPSGVSGKGSWVEGGLWVWVEGCSGRV